MKNVNKAISRKKFFSWGVAFTSLLAIPAFFRPGKKKEPKTVKMLAQDGTLVEIDVANIPAEKEKIKAQDIFSWINKKPS